MDLGAFEDEGLGVLWGKWDGGSDREGKKRMIGVELERPPLCGVCEVETAGETYDSVLEKGLETVSRFDGGVSMDRLDMLSEEKVYTRREGRFRLKKPRFRCSSGLERELKRFINGSASRVRPSYLFKESIK
jgi:hypothetical protein